LKKILKEIPRTFRKISENESLRVVLSILSEEKKKKFWRLSTKKNVDKVLITFIESGRKVDDHDDDDGDGSSDRNEGTTAQTPVAISLSA
jgi:hypothetical protein